MQPKVRTLAEIIAESNQTYDPLRKRKRNQISAAEQEAVTARGTLANRRADAFQDIEQRASNKGVAFGTLPSIQQRGADKDVFDPAASQIDDFVRNRRTAIEDDIYNLDLQQQAQGQSIQAAEQKTLADFINEQEKLRREAEKFAFEQEKFQQQQALEREKIQAANSRAAASRAASVKAPAKTIGMERRDDGGFNFKKKNGQPASAAQYAIENDLDIMDVLDSMGRAGDNYAAQVARQLSADPFAADNFEQYKQAYPSLFWGV